MGFPLTRQTDRAELAQVFKTPEGTRAVENLQRDVLEAYRLLALAQVANTAQLAINASLQAQIDALKAT